MKTIIMRLYRIHDPDLLFIYKLDGFKFSKAVKTAIKQEIGKETSNEIEVFDNCKANSDEEDVFILPKYVQLHLRLDETIDADIIKWVSEIKSGCRNSALKNTLRRHLSRIPFEPYFNEVRFVSGRVSKIKH